MKQSLFRCLALFLVVAMTVCMLPMTALAGGDPEEEKVYGASVFVSCPIAGEHPKLTGLAQHDSYPYTVDEVHFFELDANGNPSGKFLTESYSYVANQKYACQAFVTLKAGYVFADTPSYGGINGHDAQIERLSSVTAALTYIFTCAPGTVTVSFDPNGSPDPAPAPLAVPLGGTIWDAVRNYEQVQMPNLPYERFWGWSLSPFGDDDGSYYFDETVTADLKLYAMWDPCIESVDLYVSLPESCLVENQDGPILSVPETAPYDAYTEQFFLGLVDGHLHSDLIYTGPLQKGGTYYSQAYVYLNVAGELPRINLHGAELISAEKNEWGEITVLYSVTVPAGDTLREAGAWIAAPRAGSDATESHPQIINLTPGIQMGVQGWYTDANAAGEFYAGSLEGGKTYYARINLYDGTGMYTVSEKGLQFQLEGKNARLVKLVNGSAFGTPNSVSAIVAVTIPRSYSFTVSCAPDACGRISSDRYRLDGWARIYDFGSVEEGPVTLTAKPAPGFQFKMWYNAKSFEILSRDPVYSFDLNKDTEIVAYFVERRFEDVDAWDYFYEPVMWAVNHQPPITSGTGQGQFSPNAPCTREQIMTFLWKARYEPGHSNDPSPFLDVQPGAYYYDAVLWAVENGITSGTGDGNFGVGMPCTREQAMAFLWRAAGSQTPQGGSSPFGDVHPGDYFYNAVLWAVEHRITSGTGDGNFGVGMTCTRAQIITFLSKLYAPVG